MIAHPYLPHELDAHPDRDRIRATLQLDDIEGMRTEISEFKVEVERLEEELRDMTQARNTLHTHSQQVHAALKALTEQAEPPEDD